MKQCRSQLKRFGALKEDIDRFEKEDRPAFITWLNATFGSQLTVIRELKEENNRTLEFIRIVEMIRQVKKTRYYKAYLLALDMKDDPARLEDFLSEEEQPEPEYIVFDGNCGEPDDDDWEDFDFGDDDPDEKTSDEKVLNGSRDADCMDDRDLESFFFDFLYEIPGYEDVLTNDKLFNRMFNQFKRQFFNDPGDDFSSGPGSLFEEQKTVDREPEIKAIYRTLALVLHPDNSPENNSDNLELWYRVQEAYQNSDLEELKMLQALSTIKDNKITDQCTVSQMLAIRSEHKEKIAALKKLLNEKKSDLAWKFGENKDKAELYRKVLFELSESLEEETRNKCYYNSLLKKWSRPPGKRGYSGSIRPKFVPPPEQLELPF
ncbi:MAG: J domain-containing protein [Spirochaetales bacterium]|nr:J domain-containing protein [Spirochaetales bacterium]